MDPVPGATAMPCVDRLDWRISARGIRLPRMPTEPHPPGAIVVRAPTRIDFGGGWTDVPPYSDEVGGFVCNLAISRYATVTVSRGGSPNAPAEEHFADRSIADAAARRFRLSDAWISVQSDFPVAAGLG